MSSRCFILWCLPAFGWCLQARFPEDLDESRLLTKVAPPEPISLALPKGRRVTLKFQSVIPTFGQGSSFIALLHPYYLDSHVFSFLLEDYPLFCAGPGRTHRARMKMFGGEHFDIVYKNNLVWQCDWPEEEAANSCFDVFLEDANGRDVGNVSACHNPTLLKTYTNAACVTSLWYDDSSTRMNSVLMLPQWMEFNLMHGVQHFLVYTTNSTEETEMDILRPYFAAGLATRVHVEIPRWFQSDYSGIGYSTQTWFANDCMYRLKYHTKWLFPTVDVDEYLRVSAWENNKIQMYDFDAVESDCLASGRTNTMSHESLVAHSISFPRYIFRDPEVPASEVQISSPWRESNTTTSWPKFVLKPALVNVISVHWPTSWLQGSVNLSVPETILVAHHYRTDSRETTTMEDTSLVAEVFDLRRAIEYRFQSAWPAVYARFCQSCPQASTLLGR